MTIFRISRSWLRPRMKRGADASQRSAAKGRVRSNALRSYMKYKTSGSIDSLPNSRGVKPSGNGCELESGGAEVLVRGDSRLCATERVNIYANAYFYRLLDCLHEEFPASSLS